MPELQTPMTGIMFGESPRWHDDRLWFSDWGAQELIAVDLEGKSDVIVCMPSFPFCIDSPSMVEGASRHATVFCNQVEYRTYTAQDELLDQAKEMDYLLTAYSPVAKGRVSNDATLREIGEAHGKTPTQVALRWLIQQVKVAAIPKAASEDHLRSNFDIFDFGLSSEEMERIFALRR